MQETVTETAPENETLVQTAEREASQAEAEAEAAPSGNGVTPPGNVSLVDPEPTSAALEAELPLERTEGTEYEPEEPTVEQLQAAGEVLRTLEESEALGPEPTVEALVELVDVLPQFCRPEEWPGEEDEEYIEAPEIGAIGELLIRGSERLTLGTERVAYLWRNRAKWTSRGVTVRSDTKALDTRTQFLTKGKRAVIEINFHHWKALNPLQKVFTVYHALREAIDAHPDFEGYFDELELFGSRVFRDMAQLAATITKSEDLDHPHQLGIFDEVEAG